MRSHRWVVGALLWVLARAPAAAAEPSDEWVPPPDGTEAPAYRNPRGAVVLSPFVGFVASPSGTSASLGLGAGYAPITGVLPGARAMMIFGDVLAGELAATLTLTPPLETIVVPFVTAEFGRRFERVYPGWLYGAGGGIYYGRPRDRFGLQAGWIWRRLKPSGLPAVDVSGPLVVASFRF